MSYRKMHSISNRHNSLQSKLCRQVAAQYYIQNLSQGKHIISIDESVINQTDPRQYGWFTKGQKNFSTHSQRLCKVSIIAAICSSGNFYFTLNYGNNNTDTFLLFLLKLIQHLDQFQKNWRNETILLFDNAPYHRSRKAFSFYHKHKLPILFLGPYHFRLAPIEFMFAFIKNCDLNLLKRRAETRKQIIELLKEMCVALSKMNTDWVNKAFSHVLTAALESLCLKDL